MIIERESLISFIESTDFADCTDKNYSTLTNFHQCDCILIANIDYTIFLLACFSRLFFATRFIWVVKKATVLLAGLSLASKNA